MKVTVSGQDQTDAIAAELHSRLEKMQQHPDRPHYLFDFKSARSLQGCESESEYLDTFLHLLTWRSGLGTQEFKIPGQSDLKGRFMTRLRVKLWHFLRYQHDRMAQQQNPVNWNITTALELLRIEQKRMDSEYRSRLEALEARLAEREPDDAN